MLCKFRRVEGPKVKDEYHQVDLEHKNSNQPKKQHRVSHEGSPEIKEERIPGKHAIN